MPKLNELLRLRFNVLQKRLLLYAMKRMLDLLFQEPLPDCQVHSGRDL
jgi:hypothetical protein